MIILNKVVVFWCESCNLPKVERYKGHDVVMCDSCVDRYRDRIHAQTMIKMRREFSDDIINQLEDAYERSKKYGPKQ